MLEPVATSDLGLGGAYARQPPSGFVEVVAAEPSPLEPRGFKSSGIELAFPGGLRATLAADFDGDALVRLLAQLRC